MRVGADPRWRSYRQALARGWPTRIAVRHGDTEISTFGFGTFASRNTVMAGSRRMRLARATAPPAAIANAARDALAALGAEVNETPLTPLRIFVPIQRSRHAIQEANR